MSRHVLSVVSLCIMVLGFSCVQQGFCSGLDEKTGDRTVLISFDQSASLPMGMRAETTGHARYTAKWQVMPCGRATSRPNVLRIVEIRDPSGSQFNLCWTDRVKVKDGTVQVKVRADSGRIDQGGGPMWRVTDRNNYYVARLNPLEDNFRIYFVRNGRRVMIASADVNGIRRGQWFSIRVDFRGSRITGLVNGHKLIDVHDSTFGNAGGIGLWTKADAASSFDDLVIRLDD